MSNANATKKDLSVLGPPALFDGEDGEAYDKLHLEIFSYLKPADILDEIYARDVVDLTWEICRNRRVIPNLEGVTAESFGDKLEVVCRIDGMTAVLERRRAAILRELAWHREMRAAAQQLVIENKVGEPAE
jgi:hypothetical protein